MQISATISVSRSPSLLFASNSAPRPLHKIQQSPNPSPKILSDSIHLPSAVKWSGLLTAIEEEESRKAKAKVSQKGLKIEDHLIEGFSIGGLETCVVVPTLNAAFGIGRCTPAAVHQDFLFITHARIDHIGGLPLYVATRGLYGLKPPTVIVPPCIKDHVEKLFDVYSAMSQMELSLNLVALDVGETYEMRDGLVVRPFKTHHVIPSQGYVIYAVRNKLQQKFTHLKGDQITDATISPEVAFTGDTMSDFILEPKNADALRAKILITEATFLDDELGINHARRLGHMHLFEILEHAQSIQNEAILLTHFSSRYKIEDIRLAVAKLQPKLSAKVLSLAEGFKSMYN